ncbi:MAG: methyl-accepting chemotaxis protein [Desulfovibrio sp.]
MSIRFHRLTSGFDLVRERLSASLGVHWFRNRGIGLKIGLGFGVILLFFLSAGVTTYLALQNASAGFVEYRTIARSTNLLAKIQTDLLNIRDNVKDYLITGNEDALKNYQAHISTTRARLASTKAEMDDQERIVRLNEVETKLARYNEAFSQIVELRKKRIHLVNDVIYVEGPSMGEKLNDLFQRFQGTGKADVLYQLGNTLKYLNTGRLYASRFLDTGDPIHANAADSELFLFEDYLSALDTILDGYSLKVLAEIKQSLAAYKDALTQAVAAVQRQNVLADEIVKSIGPDVAATVGDLTDSIRVRQDSLGPKLVSRNASANALVAGLLAAALTLGTLIALYLARNITLPLRRATRVMESIRLGRLDERVGLEQKDEVGRLSRAIDDFTDTLAAFTGLLRRMGQGDFSMRVPLQSPEDEIGRAAQQMVDGVRSLALGARSAAEQVSAGAGEMLEASQSLSQAATQQAASVEEITSTMQLIGSQAKTNADNAAKAHTLGQEAEEAAKVGVREMDGLVLAMRELDQSSKGIAKIIKVIDEIAFQTNLLALNAAVEAARAGKHGRGFTVVANEVRNLASRSAKAASETEGMIESALAKVAQGTKQANRTAEVLDGIAEMGQRSAALVGEISAASDEQARGAHEVGIALSQIQNVTLDNTAQAEEVAAAATELSSQSQTLQRLIHRFQLGSGSAGQLPAPETETAPPAELPEALTADRTDATPGNTPSEGAHLTLPSAEPLDAWPGPDQEALAPVLEAPEASELPDETRESEIGTTEVAAEVATGIPQEIPAQASAQESAAELVTGLVAEFVSELDMDEVETDAEQRNNAKPPLADAETSPDQEAPKVEAVEAHPTDGAEPEDLPSVSSGEIIPPEQVIALDDEEFGRY